MFTSGSTGRPKGVAIPHRAILRLIFGQTYARLDATRTLLLASAVSFDASTLELWGTLLHGGRGVLLTGRVPTPAVLADAIRRHRVTTVWLTGSLFNAVIDEAPEALAGVEEILTGGEPLSPAHVRRAFEHLPGITLVNGYGPTECTTFACCYRIPGPPEPGATSVPIGCPIANTEAYVLDAHAQLAPLGAAGELYLGGPGLARGYVNDLELTRERFVSHPFDATPGARLYRTGDRARWRADGLLELLGRTDDQVKIRGFRVEPGEVQAALAAHPGVREAIVLGRERGPGQRELVAYVVPDTAATPDAAGLREFLRRRVPDFMVPAAFVRVPALPLGPSGKVDRAALAALAAGLAEPHATAKRVRPRDPLEARLVALWEDVLGVSPVGVTDDFFALGGHSLSAVRILQQIERLFGQVLTLGALQANATVEALARALLRAENSRLQEPVLKLQEGGHRRPFFFFHGDFNGGGFYCRELARHLGPEQPLFAIHPLGLDGGPVPATIETMAAVHLALIRRLQPHGPYFIGGYCNGGLTAYEVARALTAAGERVEPVVLIAAAPDTRLRRLQLLLHRLAGRCGLDEEKTASYFGRLRYLADRFTASSPGGRVRLALGTAVTLLGKTVRRRRNGPPPGAQPFSAGTYARYFTAVMAYVPGPFTGRLLAFWPTEEALRRPDDSTLGWEGLVRQVEVIRVPGDHQTIVTRHTELIARIIRARCQTSDPVSGR
jgi:thioesterase domain-containing protein